MVDDDPSELMEAVEGYRASSRRLDRALVCESAGTGLGRHGDRTRAEAYLDEATAAYEELGARHDARRAFAVLRGMGAKRGARGPRHRPLTGPDSLTPTERSVLAFVGEGLRNGEIAQRLFVSRRTVETHVGRLYAKLQVENRVALAMVARKLADSG